MKTKKDVDYFLSEYNDLVKKHGIHISFTLYSSLCCRDDEDSNYLTDLWWNKEVGFYQYERKYRREDYVS